MNTQDAYLDEVGRRLDGLTREQREIVLDDLRGHLEDAAAAGRSAEEALAALGTPAEIAARAYEEFGTAPGAPDAADRAWRVLQWTAVATAVLIAVVVAFILPSYASAGTSSDDPGTETVVMQTLFDAAGLGAALVCLLPAVLVLVPLLVRGAARRVTALVAASVLTLFCVLGAFTIGGFFLPVALLAWAAVITAWQLRIAGGYGRGWWIAGAIAVLIPAASMIGALFTDTVTLGILAWILLAFDVVLAVLIAIGLPAAGWVVAGFGVAMLVAGFISGGLLVLAAVWFGGLFLAVGLSHALGARRA